MEKILPIAGATGAHSYAPHEADSPLHIIDEDQNSDHAISPTLALNSDAMDVDANQSAVVLESPVNCLFWHIFELEHCNQNSPSQLGF
jgi:hypothetical protein